MQAEGTANMYSLRVEMLKELQEDLGGRSKCSGTIVADTFRCKVRLLGTCKVG